MRATFSLGKSVLGFSSDVFAPKTRFHSENAYWLDQRDFAFAFSLGKSDFEFPRQLFVGKGIIASASQLFVR